MYLMNFAHETKAYCELAAININWKFLLILHQSMHSESSCYPQLIYVGIDMLTSFAVNLEQFKGTYIFQIATVLTLYSAASWTTDIKQQ